MKILFIANAIFGEQPGLSGGETRFIEIAKSWAKKGHEIHLMSSEAGGRLCKKLGLNVIFHSISDSKKTGRSVFIGRALKSLFFLPRSLKNFEGIVYSTNEMMSDVFPALRLKLGNPKNIRWTTVVHWLPPFPPWKRKKAKLFDATLFFINERISVWLSNKFADVLLPVSSATAQQLRHFGANANKIHPVECGVNYAEISDILAQITTKKYDAVFMKRLQAVKGVFDLLDIWEIVTQTRPNAKLLVIGEGIDGKKARELVKAKRLENNIQFVGTIYDLKEKITKIAQSKLFVLPTYEENWAIVVGEAMAAGTPLIAYELNELVEIWGKHCTWVPVGDKRAFAKTIVQLLDDSATRKALSTNGIEFVRQYDWQTIAEKELQAILGKA